MSHIPAAAMPHAKPHEPHDASPTIAPPIKRDAVPWGALVAGGVLAIGGAVTAASLLRGRGSEKASRSAPAGRSKTKTAAKSRAKPQTTRARKTKAADGGDS